jgi:hypothetical protein
MLEHLLIIICIILIWRGVWDLSYEVFPNNRTGNVSACLVGVFALGVIGKLDALEK